MRFFKVEFLLSLAMIISVLMLSSGCTQRCITLPMTGKSEERFGGGYGQFKAFPVVERRTPGGTMEGQFSIKNITSISQSLEYQIKWFDAQGFLLNASARTPLNIKSSLLEEISFQAPSMQAASYRISLCKV